MSKDLTMLSYLSQQPSVGIMAGLTTAMDWYSNVKGWEDQKESIQYQEDVLQTQADLQKAGIYRETYLTSQTIRRQAEDTQTQMLQQGAQQVQQAATIGASGAALAKISQNEAAKQARQAAVEEGKLEDLAKQAKAELDATESMLEVKVESLWSNLSDKPSILESAVKTATSVYTSYKAEVNLQNKLDAYAGAGKFSSSTALATEPDNGFISNTINTIKDVVSDTLGFGDDTDTDVTTTTTETTTDTSASLQKIL